MSEITAIPPSVLSISSLPGRAEHLLTGNLDFGAALHDGANSVPHDTAVVAGVGPVQGRDQVPGEEKRGDIKTPPCWMSLNSSTWL